MTKGKKNTKFMEPKKLSKELEAVVGKGPMPRTQVTKKVWAYIKKHKCQNPNNLREIIPDEKLAAVIGKRPINMFKMTAKISQHID